MIFLKLFEEFMAIKVLIKFQKEPMAEFLIKILASFVYIFLDEFLVKLQNIELTAVGILGYIYNEFTVLISARSPD